MTLTAPQGSPRSRAAAPTAALSISTAMAPKIRWISFFSSARLMRRSTVAKGPTLLSKPSRPIAESMRRTIPGSQGIHSLSSRLMPFEYQAPSAMTSMPVHSDGWAAPAYPTETRARTLPSLARAPAASAARADPTPPQATLTSPPAIFPATIRIFPTRFFLGSSIRRARPAISSRMAAMSPITSAASRAPLSFLSPARVSASRSRGRGTSVLLHGGPL